MRSEPIDGMQQVREMLAREQERAYRDFSAALLPGVKDLLGVRLGTLRRMARQIIASPFCTEFLALENPQSFEERMLLGLVTALVPACVEERFALIARFVPMMDNWSVCDSFCISLKEARGNRAAYFAFLQPYLDSEEAFEARFGAVMLLDHFVCDDYVSPALEKLARIPARGHYARMAVAWAVQTLYAAYEETTEAFLLAGRLDAQTTALTVSKIAQSRRTKREALARLRAGMRMKGNE